MKTLGKKLAFVLFSVAVLCFATRTEAATVNLGTLTANRRLNNGDVVTGTLASSRMLTIDYGASIILSNATINADGTLSGNWAGLTCYGDATITLIGNNTVQSFGESQPGIYVPENKTLTIQGEGSLTASALGETGWGAGIGGGYNFNTGSLNCGNIVLSGGTIIANGGTRSAGIGSAYKGHCGNITIGAGVNSVVATHGTADGFEDEVDAIGAGLGGDCGTVTVASGLTDSTSGRTRTILPWDGNLSTLTSDTTAPNGTVITGTLGGSYKVSIASGATVTLSNAVIHVQDNSRAWAGLNCQGGAEIVLKGTNVVLGFSDNYPGIHVPVGSTLTISGTGSLTASSNNGPGAGIGGGWGIPCGNIVIAGGTVTATGGSRAAGIGGGYADCGNITISGGDVTATGGELAPGIGGGYRASCGNITIGVGITRIVATHGADISGIEFSTAIGAGFDGSGGTLAPIPHGLIDTTDGSTRTIKPAPVVGGYSWNYTVINGEAKIIPRGDLNDMMPAVSPEPSGALVIPAVLDGYPVISIGEGAFLGCTGITSVTIPNCVTNIEDVAFYGCSSLTTVTVPESVTSIGDRAFKFTGLQTAYVGNGCTAAVQAMLLASGHDQNFVNGIEFIESWDGNLSTLTGDAVIRNDMTIYGELGGIYSISVIDGVSVTLSNATIQVSNANKERYSWAGITCLGDAEIILAEGTANTIRGFYEDYPGIFIATNKTLTISGSGTLDASSNGYGAGIGGGYNISCGNIWIKGGTISAEGGLWNAGIGGGGSNGSGHPSCGNITIDGGTVTAKGGAYGAGIGGGAHGVCGDITIGAGISRVSATRGSLDASPIGAGSNGSGGTLAPLPSGLLDTTLPNGATRTISGSVSWDGNLSTLTGDAVIRNDMTIYGTLGGFYNISVADGVSVTLSNATIQVSDANFVDYAWAGITCLGDAEIILAEGTTNTIRGFYEDYPGIFIATNKTLTISGSGSLDASSNGYGSGIGGGYQLACGNIVIASGTITATGGSWAAGIGAGRYRACGAIAITGGTITATGGKNAAGIGSGFDGSSGTIAIGAGITRVVATRGEDFEQDPIYDGTAAFSNVPSGLTDSLSANGSTRTIASGASGYTAWATANSVSGAWNALDANGVANVFRYAFNLPTGDAAILGIGFNEAGKVVIRTPPLVNSAGFTFTVVASDSVDGTGHVKIYALDPLGTGETVIDEANPPARFFRLHAVAQ